MVRPKMLFPSTDPRLELIHFKHRRNAPSTPSVSRSAQTPSNPPHASAGLESGLTQDSPSAATSKRKRPRQPEHTLHYAASPTPRIASQCCNATTLHLSCHSDSGLWRRGVVQGGWAEGIHRRTPKVQNKALRSLMGAFRTYQWRPWKQKQPFHQQERASVTSPGNTPSNCNTTSHPYHSEART